MLPLIYEFFAHSHPRFLVFQCFNFHIFSHMINEKFSSRFSFLSMFFFFLENHKMGNSKENLFSGKSIFFESFLWFFFSFVGFLGEDWMRDVWWGKNYSSFECWKLEWAKVQRISKPQSKILWDIVAKAQYQK
jgi:hypothetical protein